MEVAKMATIVTVGKLSIDLDRLSDENATAIEQLIETGELTDNAVKALAEWSATNGSATKSGEESKASKMRRMAAAGISTGDIAKTLDVRFQFVYNVLQKSKKA
jgi:hypothetical protein